ncbi:MAG: AAA family ATPase [Microscillaceae bacterium]|nr:AAA family ATPase [Microscillaceae bacterium]
MQNLPIGIQEFSEIRNTNRLYIDKTAIIYELITSGKYYFLSRPRRFGKSLLVNTLKEIFLGNQHYFKGLWIADKIEWEAYPIIKFDFTKISYRHQSLNEGINKYLKEVAESQEIQLQTEDNKEIFIQLIQDLFKKHQKQVVILIDEYDKPIIDYLENPEQAEENRDELKNLYSVIKGSDAYIKFFFMTGVSKFSKVGIFSDLNNISDITTTPAYATLLGYTQEELEFYFAERLTTLTDYFKKDKDTLLAEIRYRYNGYSWDAKNFVYNPFSVLSFFQHKKFDNYWFATGTPTFLTKLLKKGFHYEFKNVNAGFNSFDTSNLAKLDYVALLFQTGYLTLKEDIGYEMFRLDFPNSEVRDAFNQFLLAEYAFQTANQMQPLVFNLFQALKTTNFEEVKLIFNSLFASIPNDYFLENREKYYHAIVFLTLRLLGYFTQIEINSGRGRLDCVVLIDDKVFLFEFKLDKSPQEALAQIKQKNYAAQYQGQHKEIYLIGVNMVSEQKEMEDFGVEQL